MPRYSYTLRNSVEVDGRQGVCAEGGYYWVSESKTLAKYDKDWKLIAKNDSPFEGYEIEVNHIGDIDVYNNELYIGAEYFMDGVGKVHMQMPPQLIQGIAYYKGSIYITADDGNADDKEPDHLYRTTVKDGQTSCIVTLERTFDDVTMQGEIEGLTFDRKNGKLLLLYNRGARIVLCFYDGYDREISEVFEYEVK